jgi:hypothetical protein
LSTGRRSVSRSENKALGLHSNFAENSVMSKPSKLSNLARLVDGPASSDLEDVDNPVDPEIDQRFLKANTLTVDWRQLYALEKPTAEPPTEERPGLPPVLRQAMNAVTLGESPWPLYIWGEAGSGKTCATLLMLHHWDTMHGWAYFARAKAYYKRLNDANFGRLQSGSGFPLSDQDVQNEWTRPHLAVMDELNSREQATDFQRDTIQDCLDFRQGRPTVFTSNISLEDIAVVFCDRIASRLNRGTKVHVKGDQRKGRTIN